MYVAQQRPPARTYAPPSLHPQARRQANTAGAPDVLNFLRNHLARLSNDLAGMPGDTVPGAGAGVPLAQDGGVRLRGAAAAAAAAGEEPPPLKIAGQAELAEAVGLMVRKLRATPVERFQVRQYKACVCAVCVSVVGVHLLMISQLAAGIG